MTDRGLTIAVYIREAMRGALVALCILIILFGIRVITPEVGP